MFRWMWLVIMNNVYDDVILVRLVFDIKWWFFSKCIYFFVCDDFFVWFYFYLFVWFDVVWLCDCVCLV